MNNLSDQNHRSNSTSRFFWHLSPIIIIKQRWQLPLNHTPMGNQGTRPTLNHCAVGTVLSLETPPTTSQTFESEENFLYGLSQTADPPYFSSKAWPTIRSLPKQQEIKTRFLISSICWCFSWQQRHLLEFSENFKDFTGIFSFHCHGFPSFGFKRSMNHQMCNG